MDCELNIEELLEEKIPQACYEEMDRQDREMEKEGYPVFSERYQQEKKELLQRRYCAKDVSVHNMKDTPLVRKGRMRVRYLLVAILIMILSMVTVVAYEPIREMLESIMYTVFSDHVEIQANGDGDAELSGGLKKPTFVPDGYELVEEVYYEKLDEYCLVWKSAEDRWLNYYQFKPNNGSVTFTGDGDQLLDVQIGIYSGKTTVDDMGICTVFYEVDGWAFTLTGEEDVDKLIKIMESIENIN